MHITDVRVAIRQDSKLKAFACITIDDCFVVRGLKIISGAAGIFVAMPSRRRPDGTYQDVAHPISTEARELLERTVLAAYDRECQNLVAALEPAAMAISP
jgi:stage V sporulation protein G